MVEKIKRDVRITRIYEGTSEIMLDPELDLEADLGIDTVKQAETFAAVREAFDIPRQDDLKLSDFPTLESVMGFVYTHRPDLQPGATPSASVSDTGSASVSDSASGSGAGNPVLDRVLSIVADTTGYPPDMVLELGNPGGGVILAVRESSDEPLRPLDRYTQNVVRLKSRGLVYPYELIKVIAPTDSIGSDQPAGRFVELDLDDRGELVEVDRPPGGNTANIVVGEITNVTAKHPDGMTRVILLGDPSRAMAGSEV